MPHAHAVVVALDGLVFDSIPVRARAVHEAMRAEGTDVPIADVTAQLLARSLSEVIDQLAPDADATARDVMALRAQQTLSRELLASMTLQPDALAWIDRWRSRGVRVIGRSDGTRREMERVLQLLALTDRFAFVRCADDEPRLRGASMLTSAYHALLRRVQRVRPDTTVDAYECAERVEHAALTATAPSLRIVTVGRLTID